MQSKMSPRTETGSALLVALILVLVGGVITGAMVTMTVTSTRQTVHGASFEMAYQTAEAGIHRTLFQIESALGTPGAEKSMHEYLQEQGGGTFTGTVADTNYTVTLVDSVPGDDLFDLSSEVNIDGVERTVVATVKGQAVKALDYALFGNYIHFDNHNKVNFGIKLVSSVYSNSGLKIDPGISIEGPVRAVQFVEPSEGTGGLDPTYINPAAEQGDPDPVEIPSAKVKQIQPAPPVWPFPAFAFQDAQAIAQAAKTDMSAQQFEDLIQSAYDYAQTLECGGTNSECNILVPLPQNEYPAGLNRNFLPVNVIRHTECASGCESVNRNNTGRFIRVPNAEQPGLAIYAGSQDGHSPSPVDTYEVILEGDPLPSNDTVYHVTGNVDIGLPGECLVRVEGSLIVDGDLVIEGSAELLAWENRTAPWFVPLGQTLYSFAGSLGQVGPGDGYYDPVTPDTYEPPTSDIKYSSMPAVAANGKFKVVGGVYKDDTGSLTFAQTSGGPVHIEGVVYSVAESHLHRSEFEGSAYSVGSEIADIVHNCQFFSFAYDPEARNTIGFGNRITGREKLTIVRFSEGD